MKNYEKLWLVAAAAKRDFHAFDSKYAAAAGKRLESRLEHLAHSLNSLLKEFKAGLEASQTENKGPCTDN